jgi:phage-related protein
MVEDVLPLLPLAPVQHRRGPDDLADGGMQPLGPVGVRLSELIESVGLPSVKQPYVRHIRGQLWEIRLKGKAGIARALYVTAKEQRVVIVRAFIKKTEKTPRGEIDLALQRAKELKP